MASLRSGVAKCSIKHLEEYRNGIHEYLLSKNIKDFSKYEISIKDDKLHFNKWEYVGDRGVAIPQPTNVRAFPLPPKFVNVETRLIYIEIKNTYRVLVINAMS